MDCNKKWRDAVGYAWEGLYFCLRRQWHIQVGLMVCVIIGAAAWYLGFSPLEWAMLLLAATLVLALEMVNTALEAVVDLVTPDYHPLAKIAKDVAAGAVLLACLAAGGVGFFLFIWR